MLTVFLVVDEDGQGEAILVQHGASDDTQVIQWQAFELVHSDQDVACHLPDGLQRAAERGKEMKNENGDEEVYHHAIGLEAIIIQHTNMVTSNSSEAWLAFYFLSHIGNIVNYCIASKLLELYYTVQ